MKYNTFTMVIGLFLSITLHSTTHIIDSNAETGIGTLYEAIQNSLDGDTIVFDTILDGVPIYLNSTNQLDIHKNLTIIGNGMQATLIDANNNSRVFFIDDNSALSLEKLSLLNGNVTAISSNGGAILNYGTLALDSIAINNCQAENGGAIYTTGFYEANATYFNSNVAGIYGGAIFHEGYANLMIPFLNDCHFKGNSAGNDGGAMYNNGHGGNASPLAFSCSFAGNYAGDDGGAIYNNGHGGISNPVYLNCTFAGNKAEDKGGAMCSYGSWGIAEARVFNSIIWNNTALTNPTFGVSSANTSLYYCLIQESTCPSGCNCNGNEGMRYNENPLFVEPIIDLAPTVNGNFMLSENSPAIDIGINHFLTDFGLNDLLNSNRVIGAFIDMGAFEFDPPEPTEQPQEYNSLLEIKVFLEGTFDATIGAMSNKLAEDALLPLEQPYKNAPYYCTDDATLQSIPPQMVDWVLVEIRTDITPESRVDSKAGLLMSDGHIKEVDGNTNIGFDLEADSSYYIVIRHRNHLDIMTATATLQNSTMTYDFTSGVNATFGSIQQKLIDGKAVMFAGDLTQDGVIQIADSDIWKANPAQLNVYNTADINLDGSVQTTDLDLWMFNRAKISPLELGY